MSIGYSYFKKCTSMLHVTKHAASLTEINISIICIHYYLFYIYKMYYNTLNDYLHFYQDLLQTPPPVTAKITWRCLEAYMFKKIATTWRSWRWHSAHTTRTYGIAANSTVRTLAAWYFWTLWERCKNPTLVWHALNNFLFIIKKGLINRACFIAPIDEKTEETQTPIIA